MKKTILVISLIVLGVIGCTSVEHKEVNKPKEKEKEEKVERWSNTETSTKFYTANNEDKDYEFWWNTLEGDNKVIKGMQVEVLKRSGSKSAGYGGLFCYQDDNNYYRLLITVDGYYKVEKILDGESHYITPWGKSRYLKKGYNVPNKIGVVYEKEKNNFIIMFNGNRGFEFKDESFNRGEYGMFVDVSLEEDFPENPVEVIWRNESELLLSEIPKKMENMKTEDGDLKLKYEKRKWIKEEDSYSDGDEVIGFRHYSDTLLNYIRIYNYEEELSKEDIEFEKDELIKRNKKLYSVESTKEEVIEKDNKIFIKLDYIVKTEDQVLDKKIFITGKGKKLIMFDITGLKGYYETWEQDLEKLLNDIEFQDKIKKDSI